MTDSTDTTEAAYLERLDSNLLRERYAKVAALREAGENPFPNGLVVTDTAAAIFADHGTRTAESLESDPVVVTVAGRIRFSRGMGKAVFLKIQDRTVAPGIKPSWEGEPPTDDFLQLFVSRGEVGERAFDLVRSLDLGDVVWASGRLMRTRTGELSVMARELRLATKSIRPLPEKFKGLSDVEQRQRQRYVDLVVNHDSRAVFLTRARVVSAIRRFFDAREFVEVETPMMHVTPGGAAARPFATHHNALDMPLYLRIAPELFLKRLVVGGIERVYELNRNFRNEGLSRQHNPEFTMLEFYQAYATFEDLMALTETLVSELVQALHGDFECTYQQQRLDFRPPWRRATVLGLVAESLQVEEASLRTRAGLESGARAAGIDPDDFPDDGKLALTLFEELCESSLIQPTFVTAYPASVSPLARRSDTDPSFCDRFELFVAGKEIANGFSELNDPADQYGRFVDQIRAREAGDDEAMPMDDDYVRALEYGMPPTAGEGIGIDRLVMLLTDSASIRDVILFPHMRPESAG